jgi:hypothetical protein
MDHLSGEKKGYFLYGVNKMEVNEVLVVNREVS